MITRAKLHILGIAAVAAAATAGIVPATASAQSVVCGFGSSIGSTGSALSSCPEFLVPPTPEPPPADDTTPPDTTVTPDETTPPEETPYYKNCTEARAAGVTPLYRGEPGYAPHLDRDDDGIACE